MGVSTNPARRPRWVVFFLLAVFLWPVAAQSGSESYAFVTYAEGYDLSIFRNGEFTTYDVLVDDVVGMPLLAGDLVQTDADTFVELQVMPARTTIRVAENTTFEIERIGGTGGGTLNITYGRLRARVERVSARDPFEVRGYSVAAGVRGTDFGYDSVVEREQAGELRTRVYVFEGVVDVTESQPDRVDGALDPHPDPPRQVRISANQMVAVAAPVPEQILRLRDDPAPTDAPARPAPERIVFEPQDLSQDIQEFWRREDFREEPIDPDRVEEQFPGMNARVEQLSRERVRFEALQRLRRDGLLTTGEDPVVGLDEEFKREPERESVALDLEGPSPSDRAQRILLPQDGRTLGTQTRIAGHWFMGLGLAIEAVGAASAWYGEGARSVQDLEGGSPTAAIMTAGGVFITSGLISYLISLIAD